MRKRISKIVNEPLELTTRELTCWNLFTQCEPKSDIATALKLDVDTVTELLNSAYEKINKAAGLETVIKEHDTKRYRKLSYEAKQYHEFRRLIEGHEKSLDEAIKEFQQLFPEYNFDVFGDDFKQKIWRIIAAIKERIANGNLQRVSPTLSEQEIMRNLNRRIYVFKKFIDETLQVEGLNIDDELATYGKEILDDEMWQAAVLMRDAKFCKRLFTI